MFIESCGDDLDELADVTCSYAAFCRDMIITCKRVKMYLNNKPWVNRSVKSAIQAKKLAFKHGTVSGLQIATKELKIEILRAKHNYKLKLENKMASNNLGSAWSSMKAIAGLSKPKSRSTVTLDGFDSDFGLANALNCFYSRFDTFNSSKEIQEASHKLKDNQQSFHIEQKDIEKAFFCIRTNKSYGPDNICGQLLKSPIHYPGP